MYAHSQFQVRLFPQSAADLYGAASWSCGISEEHQSHAIPRWQTEQLATLMRATELWTITNDLLQQLDDASLFVRRQLGVRHNVHE
jgi:hypothetical protein